MKIFSLLFIFFSVSIQAQINGTEKMINSADSLIKLNKFHESKELLKMALNSDSENIEVLNRLFAIEYYVNHDNHSSLKYLPKICEIQPVDECYNILGRLYEEIGDYDSALLNLKKSVELNPSEYINYLNIGFIYKNLKNNEKALEHYLQAYKFLKIKEYLPEELDEKQEDFGIILYNLGNTLYSFKEYEKSNKYFLEALPYNYEMERMNNGLGNNYMRLEKYNEALKYYDQTLKINPDYLYSINGKGNALYKLGNIKEACIYWKQAIDKGYEYKDEWLEQYDITNPNILINQNCKN